MKTALRFATGTFLFLATCIISCSNPLRNDAPIITAQSNERQTFIVGDSVIFFVKVISDSPVSYRWIKNSSSDTVGVCDTLILHNIQASDSNTIYKCLVRNSAGVAVSSPCALQLYTPWDTSFVVAGVQFPDSAVYKRAVVSAGSNWRMSQFLNKCKTANSVTIGFIGGSITSGARATTNSLRFSSLLCTWLKKNFRNLTAVNEINAGIGGTDSRFGCSRVATDLLANAPDLIVVDYAVNDNGAPTYVQQCMEGLIRQCLTYSNNVPVMLLYMSNGSGDTIVQTLHSAVGVYYGLPMISYRNAIWPLMSADEIGKYPNTFFSDNPHPNDTGHKVCAYLLYSFIKNMVITSQGQEQPVPDFKYTNIYQYAKVLTLNDTVVKVIQDGWQTINNEKARLGFKSIQSDTSAVLTLKSRCNDITIGINTETTDTSSIHVVVDNGLIDTVFNNYISTNFISLFTLETTALHTIRIEHASNNTFTINYILYAAKPD
ncbi:MAG TPA: hypothetical protein DCO75_06730 [Fibrobacteres bacterium]|jgi:lysophospholipase L1-like esterase|nr:hypothetical protein [Fibrobacterota bacterium]